MLRPLKGNDITLQECLPSGIVVGTKEPFFLVSFHYTESKPSLNVELQCQIFPHVQLLNSELENPNSCDFFGLIRICKCCFDLLEKV